MRGDADDGDDVDVNSVRKRARTAKKINEAEELLAQILEWLDDNDMARLRGGGGCRLHLMFMWREKHGGNEGERRMKGRIEPLRGATVHRQGGDVIDLSDDVGRV